MSDQIHLRIGAKPWLPADTAKIDKVLNFYDVPLAGIIRQHRRYFLFQCLDGYGQDTAVWAYVPIDRAERRQLRKAKGERLKELSTAILTSRQFAAVLTINYEIEIGALVEKAPKPKNAAKQAISHKVDRVHNAGNLAFC